MSYRVEYEYISWSLITMIPAISRARTGGNERGRGSMEEFEGKRRGMLTTGELCNPVSNMLHYV